MSILYKNIFVKAKDKHLYKYVPEFFRASLRCGDDKFSASFMIKIEPSEKACYSLILFPTIRLYTCRLRKKQFYPAQNSLIDMPSHIGYPCPRPGRPGAAEPAKPRQGRKTATVRECLWVPPVTCPDIHYPLCVMSF